MSLFNPGEIEDAVCSFDVLTTGDGKNIPKAIIESYKECAVSFVKELSKYIEENYGDDKRMFDKRMEEFVSSEYLADATEEGYAVVQIPAILPNELLMSVVSNGAKFAMSTLLAVQTGIALTAAYEMYSLANRKGFVKHDRIPERNEETGIVVTSSHGTKSNCASLADDNVLAQLINEYNKGR